VWFAAPRPPYAGKLLCLDGEHSGPIKNVAPMSTVAPSYAPEGHTLIVAAAPGEHDDSLADAATAQLRRWFGAQVDDWRVLRIDHIAHAQPVQAPGFAIKRRQHLDGGLWVTGDHRDSASIQGAMFSGRRCGEAVATTLGRSHP
jgi:phytoene dehydrogenase-like protein